MLKASVNSMLYAFSHVWGDVEQRALRQVAKLVPESALVRGQITVRLGQAQQVFKANINDEPRTGAFDAELRILRPIRFVWLLETQGDLGFAKAYMEGVFETPDLHALLNFAFANRDALNQVIGKRDSLGVWHRIKHRLRHNSIKNARKNISAHYDLGNAFYALWLDETMTYSSALFECEGDTLATAQRQKNQRILEQIDVQSGDSVLEVGCGWGGFAEMAAAKGASVKGLTLSTEQAQFANKRLTHLNAEAVIQDYRDEIEQYDHIVSIEMFEAVGKAYWQDYFSMLKRSVRDNGKAVLQIITLDGKEEEITRYQNDVDFIQAYIFPGGLLPSLSQLKELATSHGFRITNTFAFGKDYAETLRRWRHTFSEKTDLLRGLGYDDAFQRLWQYYLVYCEIGFDTGNTDVVQLTLEKVAKA